MASGGEFDAALEVDAVPEVGGAVGLGDDDHGILTLREGQRGGGVGRGGEGFAGEGGQFQLGAGVVAGGAVENVIFGDLVVAGLHEFFLDDILDFLDVEEGLLEGRGAFGDGFGDGRGGRGIFPEGEEGLADGDLDLGGVPRDDLVVPADQAHGDVGGLGAEIQLLRALEQEALGDVMGVVVD
jgi:hypothetical protein